MIQLLIVKEYLAQKIAPVLGSSVEKIGCTCTLKNRAGSTGRDCPGHPLLDETRPQVIESSPARSARVAYPDLEPYSSRRLELSSHEGCVMRGNRIHREASCPPGAP